MNIETVGDLLLITIKGERVEMARRGKSNKITSRQLRELSDRLTAILKTQIRKQGHVDTGKMVQSIEVKVTSKRGRMITNIKAVNYWKYVNGNFDILDNATSTRRWESVEEDFKKYNT
jgi:hypothetical protein